MKLAVAGKGGVGKTTLTAWLGDYLARQGQTVWMVDADTALSLGQASGLERSLLPAPLIRCRELVEERIRPGGGSMLALNPKVDDLLDELGIPLPASGGNTGEKKLLVMGALSNAGGGCACDANALLKALLAHLVLDRHEWVLVDLEAGVEHLGRGTVAHVDHLLIVSEPSLRALETAAEIGRMASDLGLAGQTLVLNRARPEQLAALPDLPGLPHKRAALPHVEELANMQLASASVVGLDANAQARVDVFLGELLRVASAD